MRVTHQPGFRALSRALSVLTAVSLVIGGVLLGSPARSDALRRPIAPALAGSDKPIAVAAADALSALWADDPSYADRLALVVPLVAAAAKVVPDELAAAWAKASPKRMIVLLSALSQVGVPYRARKAAAGVGFDCSGLTSWSWSQVGKYLPHQSGRQIRAIPKSSKDRVLPADILYYPGHAMLALGVGLAMVHAPYPGKGMEVSPPSRKWARFARVGTPDGQRAPAPPEPTTTSTTSTTSTTGAPKAS